MVAAVKLPMLNPSEFKLWKMRIKQYFLMTDYALWEVIVNGDSHPPKRTVDGVEKTYPHTTTKEKLAKKNELKARCKLYMALPNEHQLKFNSYKKVKSLIEAIENRFRGNKESKKTQKTLLKQQYANFNGSSSKGLDQTYDKIQKLISQLEILDNEDLKQIDADDLEKVDLKWQMAMLTIGARRFLKKTERKVGANGSETIAFDKTKVECYNCYKRCHFAWECRAPRENRNREPAEDGPTNFALMAYTSSSSSSLDSEIIKVSVEARLVIYKKNEDIFEDNIKILKLNIHLRDNALTKLRKKLEKAKKERDEIKITLEKFENSTKTLNKMLDSQVNDKNKTGVGYHAVPLLYTGNFMPPKPNLILTDVDEYVVSESVTSVPAGATNKAKTRNLLSRKSIIGKPNTLGKTVKVLEYICKHNKGQLNGQRVVRPVWNNTRKGNPHIDLQEKGIINSGCSRNMTGNMSYLSEYEKIDGGYVGFRGDPKGGKINGKDKISTGKLDFEDVYFVKKLKFNLFSVSQMCDKKNNVLFTDTKCVVLSPDFKLTDESHVLLKVARKDNMYNFDLKNVVPQGGLTCLFVKTTLDESNLWHRRLGHKNFKTMNKLKGKQHKASYKTNTVSSISQPLQMLHMDLFGLTFVKSLMKKMYCLVVTDDFSRFSWVFFLATKDETSGILKAFITGIENLIDHKVKIIRCNNGIEFKNKEMNIFSEKQDHLGKFDRKADEGFFVRYSVNSKAFRVFNNRTMIVEETLHITFFENKPNVVGSGPTWLFNIDTLTKSMNYKPVVAGNKSNGNAGEEEKKDAEDPGNEDNKVLSTEEPRANQEKDANVNSTNNINTVSPTANINDNDVDENIIYGCADDPNMPNLEEIVIQMMKMLRGIVVRNKARLVAHGYTQEEGIYYGEVFDPVARIEAIRLFLAHASFKDFVVYQMYVKSAFLYGKIEEEVYVCQPPGFEDPEFPDRVYKVEKASYGLHQALRAWYETLSTYLLDNGFQRDKYVDEIFKKFGFSTVKTASTPMETLKPLMKDENVEDVDVHLYRSMTGSLMYLTYLRPNIMFHDSPFNLEAYTDSDYAGSSLDMKSTTRGCQFLRSRLISWQCKKQTVVSNSTTEVEYVAASNCCRQAYTYYCQLKVNAARRKLTTAVDINAATAMAKNVNGEAQIHAKVDGKKVIISKATIRRDLKFEDEGGVDCLSNKVIFEQLPLMGNMKRVGKDFSGRETPLFPTMIVQAQEELGKDTVILTDTQHPPTIIQPTTSQPQRKQKPMKTRRKDTELPQTSVPTEVVADEAVYEEMYDSVERAATTTTSLDAKQDRGSGPRRQETIRDAAAQTRVLNLETTKTTQAKEISSLKRRVKRLEKKKKSRTHGLKRLYKVGISGRVESSAKEQSLDKEDASKHGRNITDIDVDAETTLGDETTEDQGRYNDQEMFDAGVLDDEEVFVEKVVVVKEIDAARDQVSNATSTAAKDLTNVDADAETTLVDEITEDQGRYNDQEMFDTGVKQSSMVGFGKLTTAIDVNVVEQFWATTKAKNVNGEEQIQALVDKKKVIIIETSVKSDLHLKDAEGTEYLPTATIFKQLTPMSTMASAIICLATNQNFNFSKYIFDHIVKNLEDRVKFLMFPRFIKVFLDSQVEGMLKHKEIYVTPSHTKNFFANMKRQGKDFSGKVTPLFGTKMVQPKEDIGEDLEIPSNSHHTPTITQPSTSSQPQQKQKSKKSKIKITEVPQLSDYTHDVADEHVTTTSNDPLLSGEDRPKLTELMELCTQLQSRVLALETTKADQALEIRSLTKRGRNDQDMFDTSILDDEEVVAKKEVSTANPVLTSGEVVTTDSVEVSTAAITSHISMDEITLAKALIDIKTSKPKAKGILIQEPKLVKGSKKVAEGSSKRAADKLEQEDTKRQRIKEENKSVELKRCLEIILDNADDVTIKATPLSFKSLTIVDYKIYKEGRKRFFKIIKTDGFYKLSKIYSSGIKNVLKCLSALVYCKDLDTTTLRGLIDSESRLIFEDPQHGVPRVGIPRPPRASILDLYDRIDRMEIRQEAIKHMEYRQSYH
uniref:Integrase catalytic domain-containing protein n=1 Tax=Tanacetum cinerariifolium TaxID=118510 RepID=A0A6L2JQB3_TANCI|nr:hypothetical protein [Tanacetum cinerariifolium]